MTGGRAAIGMSTGINRLPMGSTPSPRPSSVIAPSNAGAPRSKKNDEGGRLSAVMEKVRAADPTEGPPAVGKDSGSFIEGRDPQRLKNI